MVKCATLGPRVTSPLSELAEGAFYGETPGFVSFLICLDYAGETLIVLEAVLETG